jgi:hypothetical protein
MRKTQMKMTHTENEGFVFAFAAALPQIDGGPEEERCESTDDSTRSKPASPSRLAMQSHASCLHEWILGGRGWNVDVKEDAKSSFKKVRTHRIFLIELEYILNIRSQSAHNQYKENEIDKSPFSYICYLADSSMQFAVAHERSKETIVNITPLKERHRSWSSVRSLPTPTQVMENGKQIILNNILID